MFAYQWGDTGGSYRECDVFGCWAIRSFWSRCSCAMYWSRCFCLHRWKQPFVCRTANLYTPTRLRTFHKSRCADNGLYKSHLWHSLSPRHTSRFIRTRFVICNISLLGEIVRNVPSCINAFTRERVHDFPWTT